MIEVLQIPALATVQDLGRDGFWRQGLGRAGAMDPVSLRLVNLLLGNPEGAAAIEIPLTPARFRFVADTAFALAGADCGATLDGGALPRIWAGRAKAGQELHLGPMKRGGRVYLALPGGIEVPEVLGSRSTQLREAFGGFEGRVLRAGDRIAAASDTEDLPPSGLSIDLPELTLLGDRPIELRALPSSEHDSFTAEALDRFWSEPYRVTPQMNRQGYRLEGAELTRDARAELRSHGIVPGIVQVPHGGQPIVQLADSATMGGYPKIAAIIGADLWRIAQARPGDHLRFIRTDLAGAAAAEAELEAVLGRVADARGRVAAAWAGWR